MFVDRETRRQRISERLRTRLDEGMIEVVQRLLAGGIHPDDLITITAGIQVYYLYLMNRLSREEMVQKLEVEIHRFAKRQMTWFSVAWNAAALT